MESWVIAEWRSGEPGCAPQESRSATPPTCHLSCQRETGGLFHYKALILEYFPTYVHHNMYFLYW